MIVDAFEKPENVYCVGGLGVDNINFSNLYSKSELGKKFDLLCFDSD